ncbi:MAG: transposase [Sarcina sp.]
MYKYVGDLNDRKNVAIVLSYPKESFHDNNVLKAFISLDFDLSISEILNHYNFRWDIEPFFKDCKGKLGLNGYQMRKLKSVKRYLVIMLLNYIYCKLNSKFLNNFTIGFKKVKKNLEKEKIKVIVNATKKGLSLAEIFKLVNVA